MITLSTKSTVNYNLAVALCDVVYALLIDFEADLKHVGHDLTFQYKQRYRQLQKTAMSLRILAKDMAKDGYVINDIDSFCDDSDWLYDILLLIVDRMGESREKMDSFKELLMNMESELKILNK